MKVKVIEDAMVLLPNKEHQNFTEGNEVIEKNTILNGNVRYVQGMRRGEPFTYKVFITKNKKIIYLNKIIPMETTEITLGADSGQTPTRVDIPSTSNFGWRPVLGAVIGVGAAHYYAKKKGYAGTKYSVHLLIGGVAGWAIGKYIQSQGLVKVKPSK